MCDYTKWNILDLTRIRAVKVAFKDTSLFKTPSFIETGMVAWLTKIEVHDEEYRLFFDFADFLERNKKYFTERYSPPITYQHYAPGVRSKFTALEVKQYNHKLEVAFARTKRELLHDESKLKQSMCIIDVDSY